MPCIDIYCRSDDRDYWIGLYKNLPQQQEKTGWYWLDGQPYNTSLDVLWNNEEPSGGSDEKCARIVANSDDWFDRNCYVVEQFICKKGECKLYTDV